MLPRMIAMVTGVNRGLGAEFLRQLAANPRHIVIGTTRVAHVQTVQDQYKNNANVHIWSMDLSKESDIQSTALRLQCEMTSLCGSDWTPGLNLLINNAGVNTKSARLEWCSMERIQNHFLVNVTAPLLLTRHMLPLLQRAGNATKTTANAYKVNPDDKHFGALVVNVSSNLGAIEHNNDGLWMPYRCSKAALNQASRSLARYLGPSNVRCMALDPGWVQTDMGGLRAPLTAQESVSSALLLFMGEGWQTKFNGSFVNLKGEVVEW